jgi:hypothetical protein
MCNSQRLKQLEDENRELERSNAALKAELELLKMHPVFLAGLKGETLICDLVGGKLTSFAESYDIAAGRYRIEVKYSNLGIPVRGSPTRRWSWSKPLGSRDRGKVYDYLILVGEKDGRFPDQYLDTSPYVCFFIPRNEVESLMFRGRQIGGIIQITTNFKTIWNQKSKLLKKYMVKVGDVLALLDTP